VQPQGIQLEWGLLAISEITWFYIGVELAKI